MQCNANKVRVCAVFETEDQQPGSMQLESRVRTHAMLFTPLVRVGGPVWLKVGVVRFLLGPLIWKGPPELRVETGLLPTERQVFSFGMRRCADHLFSTKIQIHERLKSTLL